MTQMESLWEDEAPNANMLSNYIKSTKNYNLSIQEAGKVCQDFHNNKTKQGNIQNHNLD